MANKYKKRCSTSLTNTEEQIKTTVRYPLGNHQHSGNLNKFLSTIGGNVKWQATVEKWYGGS